MPIYNVCGYKIASLKYCHQYIVKWKAYNAIPILSYFGLYKIVKTRFWSLMVDHNEDQSYLIDSDNAHSYMNSIKPIIVRG